MLAFDSPIFTVTVGEGPSLDNLPPQTLNLHEQVLCKSPVFAAMCTGQFLESANRHIDLPDDNPRIFRMLAEWLYFGNYDCILPTVTEAAYALRDVFLMADKYDLPGLKTTTITKLTQCLNDPIEETSQSAEAAKAFYEIIFSVYEFGSSKVDDQFRSFYMNNAWSKWGLVAKSDVLPDDLQTCLDRGGQLAKDTFFILKKKGDRKLHLYAKLRKNLKSELLCTSYCNINGIFSHAGWLASGDVKDPEDPTQLKDDRDSKDGTDSSDSIDSSDSDDSSDI